MKVLLILVLVIVASLSVKAQPTVIQFLSSPITDIEYQRAQASQAFIEQHQFRSPWLREFDFRMRTNDTQFNLDEYRLRLGLLNPWEMRANRNYRSLVMEQSAFDLQKAENEVLSRRYELLLEHYFLFAKSDLLAEQQRLLESQWQFYINEPGNLSDLITMRKAATKLKMDSLNYDQKLNWLARKISEESGISLQWEGFDFISPEEIAQAAGGIGGDDENLFTEEIRRELALEEQLLKIEKAEAFSNIGFFQAEYDRNGANDPNENLGFQLGIQLPLFNTDRPDIERTELDMVAERVDAAMAEASLNEQLSDIRSKLMMAFGQYQLIQQEKHYLEELKGFVEKSEISLDVYLEMADYHFYLRDREIAIRSTMVGQYINLLDFVGALAKRPLKNYLSSSLETFEFSEP